MIDERICAGRQEHTRAPTRVHRGRSTMAARVWSRSKTVKRRQLQRHARSKVRTYRVHGREQEQIHTRWE
eukprot:6175836-Pleurochrysis_carterae.AAC.2